MSWMPLPFRTKAKRYSFNQFKFPDVNLEEGLESYARFLFTRLAFLKGTPCALMKNRKFIPKGDLTLLHVRQHAERESVVGISLVQKSTGLTKSVCCVLENDSVIDAVGQGCRLVTAMNQDNIQGLIELCPDRRIRVWALLNETLPIAEAVKLVAEMKRRAFISSDAKYFPNPETPSAYVELPPYPDPDTGRWSLVLTLSEAEKVLDGSLYTRGVPDWDELLGEGFTVISTPNVPEKPIAVVPTDGEQTAFGGAEGPESGMPTETAEAEGSSQAENSVVYLRSSAEEETSSPQQGKSSETEEVTNENINEEEESEESQSSDSDDRAEHTPKAYSLTPLSSSVPGIIGQLLNPTRVTISTASATLNEVLNGGWSLQRIYLMTGSVGSGKSTFCAWTADFAAGNKIPVVYVSFEAPKEHLSIYALSRTAKIDSAVIEHGLRKDRPEEGAAELRKTLMAAGRKYFRIGDYLHVLEADCETTVADVREAIRATRRHFGIGPTDPILVVIDSVREIHPSGNGSRGAGGRPRLVQALLELRIMAQAFNVAILATLETPNRPYSDFVGLALDSKEFEAAGSLTDTCFVLESQTTRTQGDPNAETGSLRRKNSKMSQDILDRMLEDTSNHPTWTKRVQSIRRKYPLNEESKSTYCRLMTIKNRGGRTDIVPLFRYHRAFHDFEPIPFDEES